MGHLTGCMIISGCSRILYGVCMGFMTDHNGLL